MLTYTEEVLFGAGVLGGGSMRKKVKFMECCWRPVLPFVTILYIWSFNLLSFDLPSGLYQSSDSSGSDGAMTAVALPQTGPFHIYLLLPQPWLHWMMGIT